MSTLNRDRVVAPAPVVESAPLLAPDRAVDPVEPPPGHGVLEYELARLPRDVTTAITWYMEEEGISQRELARRMKLTPGRVSQILSGDENLTLRTLAAVCVGLGAHFQLELAPNTGKEAAQDQPSKAAWHQAPASGLLVSRPPDPVSLAPQVEESSYSR